MVQVAELLVDDLDRLVGIEDIVKLGEVFVADVMPVLVELRLCEEGLCILEPDPCCKSQIVDIALYGLRGGNQVGFTYQCLQEPVRSAHLLVVAYAQFVLENLLVDLVHLFIKHSVRQMNFREYSCSVCDTDHSKLINFHVFEMGEQLF